MDPDDDRDVGGGGFAEVRDGEVIETVIRPRPMPSDSP